MAEGQTHIFVINDDPLGLKLQRRISKLNKEECKKTLAKEGKNISAANEQLNEETKKEEGLLSSMVENSKKDDHNV